ncbi:MAG: hypothetical protein IJS67_00480 [Clostridia bacterium]|nr:hypothetical protein [Clostridia bacterium]
MKIHTLKPSTAEYRISPQVVLVNKESEFTAIGLGIETEFKSGERYIFRIIPQEQIGTVRTLVIGDTGCYDEVVCVADEKGVLRFSYTFNREQIYTIRLVSESGKRLNDFKIFAAEKDLFLRTPMRGNTHCHTCKSLDAHEDPVVTASVYRKAGFDYLAITDHHNVEGSLYAVEKMKDLPTEMALYYGEEVHVPNPYIHVVNVGAVLDGNIGLDRWYHEHEEEVKAVVNKTAEKVKDKLPEGLEPLDYAWRKWIADTIHSKNGIAIIAHPFWEYDAHNTSNDMFRYLIETRLFDAAEILHGQDDPSSTDANQQFAFWNDLRAEGHYITPVGSDDSHRRSHVCNFPCDFNNVYTVIFAPDPSFEGFSDAIKKGYSVAVESYGGAPEHVVSSYRLTKYALFLLDEYFPLHDELCFEEGRAIKEAYLGDEDALNMLKSITGRVKKFTDKFFGRK